jgi:acyl carrier protein
MASYEDTLKVTTDIIQKHVEPSKVKVIRPADNIQADLGLDSLGVMEVVAEIEDRFNITIPNDMLNNIVTVDDVAKALVKLNVRV